MEFGSFIPKRGSSKRPASTNPPPSHVDPSATVVSGWQGILADHINAQDQPPQTPTPYEQHLIRHNENPAPVGNRQANPRHPGPQPPLANDAPTAVFAKIDKPGPDHRYPSQAMPTYTPIQNSQQPNTGRVGPRAPDTARSTSHPQPSDPFDVTQVRQNMLNAKPYQDHRVLRYYNDGGGITSAVGQQVISSNAAGVIIIEIGFEIRRKLIPWRRVHELLALPNDEILAGMQ